MKILTKISLTSEIVTLIEESYEILDAMEPLYSEHRTHGERIFELNARRLEIDSKIGSLVRTLAVTKQ